MQIIKYILIFFTAVSVAQPRHTITGMFPQAAKKQIALRGYDFNSTLLLSQSVADAAGNFTLNYPESYSGAALLEVKGSKSVIVLLNNEDFLMNWDNPDDFSSLSFRNSPENDAFAEGLAVYRDADIKKAGLSYLAPLYAAEPAKQQFLTTELKVQDTRMEQYLGSLPEKSYARYYLNLRRLLSDIPQTAARYPERLPLHEREFNSLNFNDVRLLHSGLYKELLDAYVVLMESSGPAKFLNINQSTSAVLTSLKDNPTLKQDVAEYLFNLFEKRSLFPAAEYIALAMLSDTDCRPDGKREALFEQYRKMAKGNTAPDIIFANSGKPQRRLYDVANKYKLVVFGASWCPACTEEIPGLKSFYSQWKSKYNLEIVFISLDTEKTAYAGFIKSFPWISSTDFKGWESKAARDYYVSGTPTMYLLTADNKIALKPVSAQQVSAWLELQ